MTRDGGAPALRGVGRVVAFNWPRYALAGAAVGLAAVGPWPDPLWMIARVGAAVGGVWLLAGLVATWWAYDRSPLYGWTWLTALLPAPPARYAVISTGLDEISPALRRLLPSAEAELLDLYDPNITGNAFVRGCGARWRSLLALTGNGSIGRARAMVPPPPQARPARPDDLTGPDGRFDAVFLVFAAHELRRPAMREALFGEIARVLRPGGSLLLVEHCRDAANTAAYGPGAWHFYPRAEWLRLGRGAGLRLNAERAMTPFVRALAYQR